MKATIVYVFPGQGSQKKGMGKGLFEEFPEITSIADKISGYSIKDLCLYDYENKLNQTEFLQPALFTVNALSYLKELEINGKPDYLAGHSLGEYNALCAAGVFDFETGLRLVKKRSELISSVMGGSMAAVIGLNKREVETIINENNLQNIFIANYNTPSQIIIAGQSKDMELAQSFFESKASSYYPLNINGAFHTGYMADAADKFSKIVSSIKFSAPSIPVISNYTAKPYKSGNIIDNMIKQMIHPVKWSESIQLLLKKHPVAFKEIGPGRLISDLINNTLNETSKMAVV